MKYWAEERDLNLKAPLLSTHALPPLAVFSTSVGVAWQGVHKPVDSLLLLLAALGRGPEPSLRWRVGDLAVPAQFTLHTAHPSRGLPVPLGGEPWPQSPDQRWACWAWGERWTCGWRIAPRHQREEGVGRRETGLGRALPVEQPQDPKSKAAKVPKWLGRREGGC